MINSTLDGRYTILERIGGGGMADVYRAHDKLLDRSVAVKVLKAQFIDDNEFVENFNREAMAAAKLSHPNIVNIYDVGCENDIHYIIMEYISGKTLKEKIEQHGPLSLEEAIHIAVEIAEGLEHAHQNNIIHCDVKPHNILMTSSGRVKVTDFGIARAVTSTTITNTGIIVGSVHYFSPEQAKGVTIGAKSDIYSLGVVLYEMLTAALPFTADSPIGIALKHIQEEPISPRKLNPQIPPILEAVILKAMAKEPILRFGNIGEMIADFKVAQNYIRDNYIRRISQNDSVDFSTQALPQIILPNNKTSPTTTVDFEQHPFSGKEASEFLPPNKKPKRWFVYIVLIMLLGSALAAYVAFGDLGNLREVKVPDVVGNHVDTARNILLNHNLKVSISENFSDQVLPGHVISQQPEASMMVKEERVINLIVSKGAEITMIPDVKGMNFRDAQLQITNSGLVLGKLEEQYSEDIAKDLVISQNPRSPAQAVKGSFVDIVISKGVVAKKIILPDFIGSNILTIKAQLEKLKLNMGTVIEIETAEFSPGTIINQNPAAASEVTEGDAIGFSIAKPYASNTSNNSIPKPPTIDTGKTKQAAVQVTIPGAADNAKNQTVKIVVTDNNGRRVVYEQQHSSGEKIERMVEGIGQIRIQVYINNRLLQEQIL